MRRRVLVTGAAGFVGSHLLEFLEPNSTDIVGWHRRPHHPDRPGVSWMQVDLLDRAAVARAVQEVKPAAIYHLAGSADVAESWQHIRETFEGNVLATHHLLESLRALDVKPRVLVACTAHVYAPQPRPIREDDELKPASPYATSKLAVEMLATRAWESDGIPAIVARAFNHVGPRQDPSYVAPTIARQIAIIEQGGAEPVLRVGSLEPKRDLTDVRDTVRAYAALIAHARPGVPYNVCSGRALAIGELVRTFAALAVREVRVVEDPARLRPNDPPLLVGDRSRITTETGWTPQIPFEQTVRDLLDYWRARVRAEAQAGRNSR
jgi:GDP-4-dehydro-6-deoxy-D-mannose reductase